ncbi:methyltransferase-like protein 27 isoform X2 [Oncorhynchus tshawytscha]|uniref:methyltransferase-like protein 27 isoform X2 n=1 Tax=Oncorhynchus tshawytscha TaxID=74940 RepID=UPI001C3D7811|nr:methyltransferase-like protein 27 isoform X2 [Oncorhynchus tshawytscha]
MSHRTFEDVKDVILSAHKNTEAGDKVGFYNTWAENYDQDVGLLDYRAPSLAANCLSPCFHGDRVTAVILDVACGTGLVAAQLKTMGFRHFVGVDGSKGMLELANKTGLYQDLKQCMLGDEPLPVQAGGYVCMTTRGNHDNLEYKAALEHELELMEGAGLWGHVAITEVEDWEKAVAEPEKGYIPGVVYVYRKSSQ